MVAELANQLKTCDEPGPEMSGKEAAQEPSSGGGKCKDEFAKCKTEGHLCDHKVTTPFCSSIQNLVLGLQKGEELCVDKLHNLIVWVGDFDTQVADHSARFLSDTIKDATSQLIGVFR